MSSYTLGQTVAFAALCSSLAAVLTALTAVHFFTGSSIHRDTHVARALDTVDVYTRTKLRSKHSQQPVAVKATKSAVEDASKLNELTVQKNDMVSHEKTDDQLYPQVAWLMSFPNRYVYF